MVKPVAYEKLLLRGRDFPVKELLQVAGLRVGRARGPRDLRCHGSWADRFPLTEEATHWKGAGVAGMAGP